MRKNYYLVMSLAAVAALSSCKKLGELSADNFTVTPTPLEAIAGQVPATIDGKFPEKYMKKKAVVTVTPVLKYEGGEAKGQSATFQGEKVPMGATLTLMVGNGGEEMQEGDSLSADEGAEPREVVTSESSAADESWF